MLTNAKNKLTVAPKMLNVITQKVHLIVCVTRDFLEMAKFVKVTPQYTKSVMLTCEAGDKVLGRTSSRPL